METTRYDTSFVFVPLPKERQRKKIQELRLIDDILMNLVFQDSPLCIKALLEPILGIHDLEVVSSQVQKELETAGGRSIRLDILAKDQLGRFFNVEMQNLRKKAMEMRTRFYVGVLDASLLEKGEDFSSLPEVYHIAFCDFDPFGKGLPLYHINRTVQETESKFQDRQHIIYVNCHYEKRDDVIGQLIGDVMAESVEEMVNQELRNRVSYFKKGDGYDMLDREYTEKEKELAEEVYKNSLKYNEEKFSRVLDKALSEKDKIISEKDVALSDKDKLIFEQSQALFEDRQRIAELEKRLSVLEASAQAR